MSVLATAVTNLSNQVAYVMGEVEQLKLGSSTQSRESEASLKEDISEVRDSIAAVVKKERSLMEALLMQRVERTVAESATKLDSSADVTALREALRGLQRGLADLVRRVEALEKPRVATAEIATQTDAPTEEEDIAEGDIEPAAPVARRGRKKATAA